MTSACNIRSIYGDDLEMLLEWRNHLSIRSYMLTRHQITMAEHRDWIGKATKDPARRLLIVEDCCDPIGFVQFTNVGREAISDWGFYARPGAAKGTGRKLGVTALDYAFKDLKLHKVCGQALANNHASIALHKNLGFLQEGFLRDQHQIEGVYHSLICFGLLKQEWLSRDANGIRG